mgnify:FL=1
MGGGNEHGNMGLEHNFPQAAAFGDDKGQASVKKYEQLGAIMAFEVMKFRARRFFR